MLYTEWKLNIQSVPELKTENWGLSIMAENNKKNLYKYGFRIASAKKSNH
jgi:hypothetical protein